MTLRILVADDSITIQKIVAMAFANEDAEVEGIGNGKEAFDKIPDFKPDIVLADVDMPGLNGFELSQKIKSTPDLASIKVLLLASDFEDFDEENFKKCLAENHISKPFKSDNIVQMVTRVMGGDSAVKNEPALSNSVSEDVELDEEPSLEELLESVEKLSTDSIETEDLIEETTPMQEKAEMDRRDPVASGTDISGQMIQEVEPQNEGEIARPTFEAEENAQEEQNFEDNFEVYQDVQPQKMENIDDLDSAFKEIVAGESKQAANYGTRESEISNLGSIVPEPEDLLERMAPSAFSDKERRPHTADEIQENINSMTDPSSFYHEMAFESNDDRFIQVTGEQVRQILEKSLDTSLQKEVSGMSEKIIKTVREVVREIVPDIARSVIREEIDKIKRI
ncbi:MAG: response regulator [Nitrospinota bacterium]|nr:response regulator [Nitrospinota bacterium]